tara:strand:+ start:221 stop:595 length:375 start_codon:yes stop_codon:yes gene_type:complete
MTASAPINIGPVLFRHRIIEIFVQKVFFHRKVPSFGIDHVDIPIAPNGHFLVFVGVVLVDEFPIVLQQFPQLGQVGLDTGFVQQVQRIDGTEIYFLQFELFHDTEQDTGQFLLHPVPIVPYQPF